MAYKTDGSSHRNGIQNEKDQINILKNGGLDKVLPELGEFNIEKRGGTSRKEDFVIITDKGTHKVSAKRKKNLKTGSYDYVNTSKALAETDSLSELKSFVSQLKNNNQAVSTTRKKYNDKANSLMKDITSDEIKKILIDHIATKNKDMNMMVTDKETGKNYWWKFSDSQFYKDILDDDLGCSLSFGRGKTSAKVIFEKSQDSLFPIKIDYNLRIRVVLNNGVKALLGKSDKNKSSTPCIKIQQDRCDKVIERLEKENILTVF